MAGISLIEPLWLSSYSENRAKSVSEIQEIELPEENMWIWCCFHVCSSV